VNYWIAIFGILILGIISTGTSYAITTLGEEKVAIVNLSGAPGAFTEFAFDSDTGSNRAHIYHFNSNFGSSGKYVSTDFVIENDEGKVVLSSKVNGVDIYTNNVLAVSVNGGNMGIGIANPSEKLDVNGNIRITGDIVSPNDICIGNCP